MEGEKVSYSFKFNNVGKEDLVITSVSTTCGCTVTDFPKDPVKPGEGGTIEVTFNSSGKSGKQVKVITVATNANPSESQLTIKANVKNHKKIYYEFIKHHPLRSASWRSECSR